MDLWTEKMMEVNTGLNKKMHVNFNLNLKENYQTLSLNRYM